MFSWIRFFGLLIAGAWIGSLIFGTFALFPVFFSPEVTPSLIPKYHAGKIAQIALQKYLYFQLACALLALGHAFWERRDKGHSGLQSHFGLLGGLLLLLLLGGIFLQPKMSRWHQEKYASNYTVAQQASAARSFGIAHGISQSINLIILAGVFWHFWRLTLLPERRSFSATTSRPLR